MAKAATGQVENAQLKENMSKGNFGGFVGNSMAADVVVIGC